MRTLKVLIMCWVLAMIFGCTTEEPINSVGRISDIGQTATGKDVIDMHGMVENRELLDAFGQQTVGKQRLIRYTDEGDPIYHDLTYRDGRVQLQIDTTKDKFGSGTVQMYDCGKLNREETETQMRYVLTGCNGEQKEIELLGISFDVNKQDRFEFVLKYGPGGTNEINTVGQELTKDLQNGQMVTVSDFGISKKDYQKIYRQLVLAGYLNEKKLSSTCHGQDEDPYDLTVYINSAVRHFQWNACDQSLHGKQMTATVKEIIKIVHAGSTYQSLPKS
ncbi:DUF4362 domain-containing protein, partial [Paenibacillus sp.]|uniref:DUF4362 domain-containing protein n=1 Tax=Paenibacillus sp. TaxID=58172 RepID=UPI00282CEF18